MVDLVEEVKQWNSPSVGANLLWKFTLGYCDKHPVEDAPVALLHFIAIPLLTNKRLLEPISNRRENLQSYVRNFEEKKDSDILVTVHESAKQKRQYTMNAIDIAVSAGLLYWDVDTGKLYPRKKIKRPGKGNGLKASLKKNGDKSEILGNWFAQHSVSTIATYLRVVF